MTNHEFDLLIYFHKSNWMKWRIFVFFSAKLKWALDCIFFSENIIVLMLTRWNKFQSSTKENKYSISCFYSNFEGNSMSKYKVLKSIKWLTSTSSTEYYREFLCYIDIAHLQKYICADWKLQTALNNSSIHKTLVAVSKLCYR